MMKIVIKHFGEKNFKKFKQKNIFNFDKFILNRKIHSWNIQNLNIVTPSKWLKSCAENSYIFSKKKINYIPWPIDTKVYKFKSKFASRKKLGLPLNKTLVVFGCMNGINDHRKGWDLLSKSLKVNKGNFELVIFGDSKPTDFKKISTQNKLDGKNQTKSKIADIFCAADLLALPSRYDNLPQVGLEAQSTGLPIICFDVGGVKELVKHKKNGFIVKNIQLKNFLKV